MRYGSKKEKMTKYILGIDPGKSGGYAFISLSGDMEKEHVFALEHGTEKDAIEVLREFQPHIKKAYLEHVWGRATDGPGRSFKFGANFGGWRWALMTLDIPFDLVVPTKWQRSLKCLTKGDKNVSKGKAQQLYPLIKVTHAKADAMLIATYGLSAEKGKNYAVEEFDDIFM
jgi:hypothetical protein